jgi:hypothetical protein
VLLSHADRTRIMAGDHWKQVVTTWGGRPSSSTAPSEGFWKISRRSDTATLLIEPLEPLEKKDRGALAEEGAGLPRFAAPDAQVHDIHFVQQLVSR